jgi:hypothetical protein
LVLNRISAIFVSGKYLEIAASRHSVWETEHPGIKLQMTDLGGYFRMTKSKDSGSHFEADLTGELVVPGFLGA